MLTLPSLLKRTRLGEELGQALPLFAGGLLAMMLMVGVVVDGGNLFQNKQSVQNAADAAALAAALEIFEGNCNTSSTSACGNLAGTYAGYNGVSGTNGDVTASNAAALSACPNTVNDTTPPATAPGCFVYPYNGDATKVEVWLRRNTSNFFGTLLGIQNSSESARAVATVAQSSAPKINFAALFDGCNAHTLLIKNGGTLTANQTIYTNSCNTGHDAFDVFGSGKIVAQSIDVVGGWETHSSTVYTTASGQTWPAVTLCPYQNSSGYYNNTGTNVTAPGCPVDGTPKLADPLAGVIAPAAPPAAVGASANVTHKGRQSNVATIVTDSPLPVSAGSTIVVSNMDDPSFNTPVFGATVISANGNTITYANTGSDLPASASASASVTSGNIRNLVATLNLSSGVPLCVGDAFTVSGVDTLANGTYTALTVNGATSGCNNSTTAITYSNPNAQTTYTRGGNPNFGSETLANCDQAATCTATIGGLQTNASVHAGDQITVTNATQEPSFDGTYAITADSSTNTVSYQPSPFDFTFLDDSITNGVATLNINGPTDPPASLAAGTKATILVASQPGAGGDPRFDGTSTVQTSNPATDVITYNLTPDTFSGWSISGGLVTLKATNVPTGLQAGDTINPHFTSGGVPGCVSHQPDTVVSSTTTQVVYQASQTPCADSSGVQAGTITILTASGEDVAGTAQVVSQVATPANGSTVQIPVDKTFGAGGTVSIRTVTATSGIATVLNGGTALAPAPYEIPSGTATLNPGTYYGGICIGAAAGKDCTGTNCNPTVPSSANVTLSPGIYYIAGGGFHVCGGSTLFAPHVMIYNTQDTGHSAGATAAYWKIGQVQVDTLGLVTLGPQNSGLYPGLTVFQDRNLVLSHDGATTSGDDCNGKSGKPSEWDIALESAGDPGGPNHALGGITGSFYDAGEYTSGSPAMGTGADFGLQINGTTSLSVYSSCIFINGTNDVFNYAPLLLNIGVTLTQ